LTAKTPFGEEKRARLGTLKALLSSYSEKREIAGELVT
jgi:hypothetical protein